MGTHGRIHDFISHMPLWGFRETLGKQQLEYLKGTLLNSRFLAKCRRNSPGCRGRLETRHRMLKLYALTPAFLLIFFKDFIYLFLEKVRERNINVWLPLALPPLGTWPASQACTLTGNQTSDPLLLRLALNSLSCTSQGCSSFLCVCISHTILASIFYRLKKKFQLRGVQFVDFLCIHI